MSIVRFIQNKYYAHEIFALKSTGKFPRSPMRKLTPFLDTNDLLRVGGRLGNSDLEYNIQHPIILPHASPIVEMLV